MSLFGDAYSGQEAEAEALFFEQEQATQPADPAAANALIREHGYWTRRRKQTDKAFQAEIARLQQLRKKKLEAIDARLGLVDLGLTEYYEQHRGSAKTLHFPCGRLTTGRTQQLCEYPDPEAAAAWLAANIGATVVTTTVKVDKNAVKARLNKEGLIADKEGALVELPPSMKFRPAGTKVKISLTADADFSTDSTGEEPQEVEAF